MTDPFDDSSWSDLAAELGVETPKPARAQEPPPEPITEEPAPADLSESLFSETTPSENGESGGESEVIELGGSDEQKKRRRRRRRGKKRDGEPADAANTEANDDAAEPTNDNLAQPSEMLRDLIRNWDVPSWDEIVGGLYRPNRG